jgi:hypothetical protein
MTPPMKLGTSTFEPYTPDTSFDLQHKRHSSKQSEGPTSSPSSRINQVDLFRVLVTPSVSPPGEQPQSMPWRQRTAQDSFDLAQNHMRAKTFHEAETEFLNAVQMFTSSKGPDSPEVMRTMSSFAGIYEDQTRPSEAPRRRRNCYVFCT